MAARPAYVALREATARSRRARPRALQRWLAPALCVAALIEAAGIGVIGAKSWQPAMIAAYRTLGQDPPPRAIGTIRVVPDPTMALADWNALLHVLQLRVVGGPDKAGAYLVAPMNHTVDSRHTLEQLRAIHGVRLAEPAGEP